MTEQISIFDLLEPESRFTSECRKGSGFENGRVRIYLAAGKLGIRELADFLKEEYGVGGHSATFPDGAHGFTDYSPKGFFITEWKGHTVEKHNWTEVAKEVKRLIFSGEYLNRKDEEKLREILSVKPDAMPIPRCSESCWT